MTEGLWAAIIGVAGTLLGTVFGWALSNISNLKGLDISLRDFDFCFIKDNCGILGKRSFEMADGFSLETKLYIYNNSQKTRIMKDIKILFLDKANKSLKEVVPYDKNPAVSGDMRVRPLNFSPHIITEKYLSYFVSKSQCDGNFKYLIKTKKIVLSYKNEKNRVKKVVLSSFNIGDYSIQYKGAGQWIN